MNTTRARQAAPVIQKALLATALGRIAWGTFALAAPRANTRLAGLGREPSGQVVYLIRVFGSRALALGLGYLLSDPRARSRLRWLSLLVDASDTVAGLGHLRSGDVPRGSITGLAAITGSYTVLDIAGLLLAERPAESEQPH